MACTLVGQSLGSGRRQCRSHRARELFEEALCVVVCLAPVCRRPRQVRLRNDTRMEREEQLIEGL